MTAIALASASLWLAAGWTMLHFLWIGAVLGLFSLVVRLALRHSTAQARYLASLACLALLAAAPVAIGVVVHRQQATAAARSGFPADGNARDASVARRTLPHAQPYAAGQVPRVDVAGSVDVRNGPPAIARSGAPVAMPGRGVASMTEWIAVLPVVWFAGTSLVLATTMTGVFGADRMRRQSRLLSDKAILATCGRLAHSLGITRRVLIAVCDRLAGPVLVGIVRPCILLPPAALAGWSPRQLEMVLLHELAHVRRWDTLVNLCQRLIEAALFFQPAVWWVSDWVRQERECACDDLVVARTGAPREYARTLLAVADAAHTRSMGRAASLVTNAAGAPMAAGSLSFRIRRLLHTGAQPMPASRSAIAVVGLSLAAAVVMPLALTSLASGDDNESQSKEPQDLTQPLPAATADVDDAPFAPPDAGNPSRVADEAEPQDVPAEPPRSSISLESCRVSPGQQLALASRRDGVIVAVSVREGDKVEKGQVLATLPDDGLLAAEADLQRAEAELQTARVDLEYKQRLSTKGFITGQEVRALQLAAERAEFDLKRAQADFTTLKAAVSIRTPIDGIVTRVVKQAGEGVKAGDPVVEVISTRRMVVTGHLSVTQGWDVRKGAPVTIQISIRDVEHPVERERFRGRVDFVSPIVDPVTGTIEIRAIVENPDGLLRGGLTAQMTIKTGSSEADDAPADDSAAGAK